MAEPINLTGVLDHLDDRADGDRLSLGEIIDSLGGRGYGPLLLSLALIEILPTGAIPGVPTLVAITVVLVAGQLALGRESLWLPHKLRDRSFARAKFEKGREKIKPFTSKLDRAIKPRLHQLVSPSASRLVGALCVVLALTMPPLELLPFASSIPATAIAFLGVGLGARDGLLVLLGLVIAVAGAAGIAFWLM